MNEIKTMKWMEIMKIPGTTKVQLSLLMILATSSVLSTGLQISRMVGNTSGGNTSGRNESLEVVDAGGRVKVTGKHTTEVLRNLQQTGNFWGIKRSQEKSSASTEPQEK